MVENPSRSLNWHTSSMKKLSALIGACDVVLSAREFGSKRDKQTRLRTNMPTLKTLHKSFSGNHPARGHDGALHASWGVSMSEGSWKFATAEECEYTSELCKAMAAAAAQAVSHARGADLTTLLATTTSDDSRRADRAQLRAQVGLQIRSRAMPKRIPELRTQITAHTIQVAASRIVMRKPLQHNLQLDKLTPAGAELVSIDSPTPRVIGDDAEGVSVLKFGIRWTPQEFLEQAKQVTHPFDAHDRVDDDVKVAIVHTLELGIDQTQSRRKEVLDCLESKAEELQHDENLLHKNMHPEIANVYKGKRFLHLREMLSSVKWPDVKLFDDLIAGMPIMGELPATGVFPADRREPEKSVEWLWSTARRTREAVRSHYFGDQDEELERFINEGMLREVELGWAVGPLSDTELTETLGPLWIPSRRFGVRQGKKLRVVDDFSTSYVNAAVGVPERVSLAGLGTIAANIKAWSGALRGDGTCVLSNGTVRYFKVHEDFKDCNLVGKCVDLAHAYLQVAVRRSHSSCAVIGVRSAEVAVDGFSQTALPYGAKGSVWGLNRPARAISALIVRILWICASNYFDDFVNLEADVLSADADAAIARLMNIIGWEVKEETSSFPFR